MLGSQRSVISTIAVSASAILAAAALWNLLFQANILTPAPPVADNATYYAWWRPIEWQTASIALLAAAGLAGIAVLGLCLRGAAGAALAIGGIAAMVAQLAQMGAQRSILAASETSIDPGVLGTIGFVADGIVAGLSLGAYASMGIGVLGLALRDEPVPGTALGRMTGIALAVGLAVLAVFSFTDPFDLFTPLLGVVGVLLTPTWLVQVAVASRSPESVGDVAGSSAAVRAP